MSKELNTELNMDEIRETLSSEQGATYWKSLSELSDSEQFAQAVEKEFPRQASGLIDAVDRRSFLKLMGASLAAAGLTGCRILPQKKVVPYVKQPEDIIPGKPLYYASALSLGGYANGVLIETNMARPTKVDGNPDHPTCSDPTDPSAGGFSDIFMQASTLMLYDPDRPQSPSHLGIVSNFEAFKAALGPVLDSEKAGKGAGIRILTETVSSPTLTSQIHSFLKKYPMAKWHQYEPLARNNVFDGSVASFGQPLDPIYHFDQAEVIVSLDSNFFFDEPGRLRYARDFGNKRRALDTTTSINRLYTAEAMMTITGAMADHRLRAKPSEIASIADAINGGNSSTLSPVQKQWVVAVVKDLQANSGRSIVITGENQPSAVHQLVHAINQKFGNIGKTVTFIKPVVSQPENQLASLKNLVQDMEAGSVKSIFIIGGNPTYTAPADINFGAALTKVTFTAHLGYYADETSSGCQWFIPESHPFEFWSDARSFDGTASIVQPTIEPLYSSRSPHEMIAALMGDSRAGYDIIHDYWKSQKVFNGNADKAWRKIIHDGVIPNSQYKLVNPGTQLSSPNVQITPTPNNQLEIQFQADPTVWDGRFANLGWLQELPKPITKLTWDNAAYISPKTAKDLGLDREVQPSAFQIVPMLKLTYDGRTLEIPMWIVPGQADGVVTIHTGNGHTSFGGASQGVGANAYLLRTSEAPYFGADVKISRTGAKYELATTQNQHNMEGRDIVRTASFEKFKENPKELGPREKEAVRQDQTMYELDQYQYPNNKWAMLIDNNVCIACNSCMIACQAENNIAIIGKQEVTRGRSMHWIRVDSYYDNVDDPKPVHMPVPCMQCEQAPCEPVCPVAATTHSAEGLNQMTYNRCVGTKYCSNNCPYKVRRFNFYKYTAAQPNRMPGNYDLPVMTLLANPDVTVRGRGVMEKCTYCTQRINAARIVAKREDRPIKDGEVMTACQVACPTQAIWFGNINDPNSKIAKIKNQPHNYALLENLNTRPRTTYLPKLRNVNTELEPSDKRS